MAQVKIIKPKRFNAKAFMAEIVKEMKDLQKDMGKDFDATVSTWDDKPKFDEKFEQSSKEIRTLTSTDDEVYTYVSRGTKAHIIRPKRAKMLAFQGGTYTAKTMPGTIKARQGGGSGDMVYTKGVKHPGTKAREFDKRIAAKWEPLYQKRLGSAVSVGAKASGHAI